jgi:hypothetical protein
MTGKAPRPPWRPFIEVRDEIGWGRFRIELREGRWRVVWRDHYGELHELETPFWSSVRLANDAMETGSIARPSPYKWPRFDIDCPLFVASAPGTSAPAAPCGGFSRALAYSAASAT